MNNLSKIYGQPAACAISELQKQGNCVVECDGQRTWQSYTQTEARRVAIRTDRKGRVISVRNA